jgi:cell division protein FtsN
MLRQVGAAVVAVLAAVVVLVAVAALLVTVVREAVALQLATSHSTQHTAHVLM